MDLETNFFNFLSFDDFETSSNWIVGDLNDTASAGIWERAIPNATYNDSGQLIQPDQDNSNPGSYCFITENGTNQGFGNASQTDVEGGMTTLYSPLFDLEHFNFQI